MRHIAHRIHKESHADRRGAPSKLSWAKTARAMVAEAEDWSSWDTTSGDGLNAIPWDIKQQNRSKT